MKTSMQELLEKLEVLIYRNTNIYARAALKGLKFEIENKFIEAEKEQIMEAYMGGKHDSGIDKKYSSEDYYQQTYNKKQ